jgi:carbamoyltransferase
MRGSFLGPKFSNTDIIKELKAQKAVFVQLSETKLIDFTAKAIARQKVIGWMQGNLEFGPRALGGRSILADPRSKNMQKQLNLKVKFRESFRPFAPSILEEDVNDWFEDISISPYMLLVSKIKENRRLIMTAKQQKLFGLDKLYVTRSLVPAITHVDYTSRIQTVSKKVNPKYYKLIQKFKEITDCPILINTSFNIRGEPIVCSPTDAFKCFMGTEIDILVIGSCVLIKEKQNQNLINNYRDKYELD